MTSAMVLLLFTGPSCTGKSTLAEWVSRMYGFALLSERQILHDLTAARGYKRTREWLAQDGIVPVLEGALRETLSRLDRVAARGAVLDGSYDRALPGAVKTWLPDARLIIVTVLADDETRQRRMRTRLGQSADAADRELCLIDSLKHRAGMSDIMAGADIVVRNGGRLEDSMKELSQALCGLGIVSS